MRLIAESKAKEMRIPLIAGAVVAVAIAALHFLLTEQGGIASFVLGFLGGLIVWAIVRSSRAQGLERSVASHLTAQREALIAEEFPKIEALSVKAERGKPNGLSFLAAIPVKSDTAYGDLIEGRHGGIPFAINEIREGSEKAAGGYSVDHDPDAASKSWFQSQRDHFIDHQTRPRNFFGRPIKHMIRVEYIKGILIWTKLPSEISPILIDHGTSRLMGASALLNQVPQHPNGTDGDFRIFAGEPDTARDIVSADWLDSLREIRKRPWVQSVRVLAAKSEAAVYLETGRDFFEMSGHMGKDRGNLRNEMTFMLQTLERLREVLGAKAGPWGT